MTQAVLHQPRVAWDAARAFVRAAADHNAHEIFADQVISRLGPDMHAEFANTRQRLISARWENGDRQSQADIEAGRWRARLEDLLRVRPDLATALIDMSYRA